MRLHHVPSAIIGIMLLCAATSALAGGPITSGTTVAGTLAGPGFLETWTFSASSGQAVLISAVTSSGAVNTNIVLKAPGGAVVVNTSADRAEFTTTSGGTWTIEITDNGLNDAGGYAIGFLNLTIGPLTNAGDSNGGPIASSDLVSGTASALADFDAYTFSGIAGQRVLVSGVATSGAGYDTNLLLYPPGGGLQAAQTFAGDLLDFQLTATGTWTIVIEDNGLNTAGGFNLSLLNVTAGPYSTGPDPDGGAIASNDIRTATFHAAGDMDAFTFTGAPSQLALMAAIASGAGTHNTQVMLFPAGGGAAVINTTADRNEFTTTNAGSWTIVVFDNGMNETGTFSLGYLNGTVGPLTNASDLNGGPIASSDLVSGTASALADFDAYTFSGIAGQRVLVSGIATSGAGYDTNLLLYPPGGGLQVAQTFAGDLLDFQLTATGTWTIVIEDNGLNTAGGFNLSLLNVTAGPYSTGPDPDGGAIASNDIRTATFHAAGDMDAFTFTGAPSQLALMAAIASGAGTHNTQVMLFPAGGGAAVINTTADRNEFTTTNAGSWTIVVFDNGMNETGTFSLGYLNGTVGPLTNAGDLNGGPIVSSDLVSGTASGLADFDAYTFSGIAGQRVLVSGVATSGAGYDTNLLLYPPGGGLQVAQTFGGDLLDFQLTATGTWTIVIEDNGLNTAGGFNLSLLNVTAGPYSTGPDPDGGAIASNDIRTATFHAAGDMDAFTFTGAPSQLALMAAVASGAGTHNTQVMLFPAGGGAAVINTTADRNEFTTTNAGSWTIVVFDNGMNETGTFSLGYLNGTVGPLTNAGDLNGGPIVSSDLVSGTASGLADFDAYTFSGIAGQRVLVSGVATSGAGYDTNLLLYPPGGGLQVAQTFGGDLLDFQLTATGTWTIVIEDNGLNTAGGFNLSLLNVTAGPYSTGPDPDGGAIASNDIRTATFHAAGDMDAFTFTGAPSQLALMAAIASGAGTHNTQVMLFPAGGGAAVINTTADRNEFTTTNAGSWTIVVFDNGMNETGTFSLGYLNGTVGPLTNAGDLNGGPIVSNEVMSGTASGACDFDAFQFTGSANDMVVVTGPATSGASYNTNILLYPPNGGLQVAQTFAGDRLEFKLTSAGTWTIVIEDNGLDTPGGYSMGFLNVTSGPLASNGDVGLITAGSPVTAAMDQIADIDGFAFHGVSGETANITATTLSGAMNTQIILYPPNGAPAIVNTGADNVVQPLTVTGPYRVVIEDLGDDQTGTYRLTLTGSGSTVGVPETPFEIPDGRRAMLLPAAPSPFRQSTQLAFHLRHDAPVRLRVYDAAGALVRTLVDAHLAPGRHEIAWDGRDTSGGVVASGSYYLQLIADGENVRRKVVRIR